jgi:DNA polymerase-3 subunit delta'
VAGVSDVFDQLVGQTRATVALREYARHPVHAYLFTGPDGAALRDAARVFAAALQCPDHGCGACEQCRAVLREVDPDVSVITRVGLNWRVEELRDAERVARRRPLGSGHQIVILENVELTVTGPVNVAAALLKTLEEPPTRTVFLLTAEETPEQLATIASRCVDVPIAGLNADAIVEQLTREGASADAARAAADAANGNLRRARVLVRDPDLAARLAVWRSVPARLDGSTATASTLVGELTATLDAAVAPLAQLQGDEMDRLLAQARDLGQRSVANRKEIEASFKREQRRFRTDELRFALATLTAVYRERLHENVARPDEARATYRVGACLRALDALGVASARLGSNMDEGLLLHDLLFELMTF